MHGTVLRQTRAGDTRGKRRIRRTATPAHACVRLSGRTNRRALKFGSRFFSQKHPNNPEMSGELLLTCTLTSLTGVSADSRMRRTPPGVTQLDIVVG